jgi:hypothetical protein
VNTLWIQILEQIGIADMNAYISYVIANSKNGPQFKAAAQNALQANEALALAAQNPSA